MKLLVLFFSLSLTTSFAQSIMKAWEPLLKQKELATYFNGMWESLGINIEETGEKVTILHLGDHFDMKEGVKENEVDYNIFLKLDNVNNMVDHGKDGVIDKEESFEIMKVLFTPFVRASLKHPMMNKKFQMKMAGIENLVHVYLRGPSKNDLATHTMIFINEEWMVIEGIHGNAKRIFEINY